MAMEGLLNNIGTPKQLYPVQDCVFNNERLISLMSKPEIGHVMVVGRVHTSEGCNRTQKETIQTTCDDMGLYRGELGKSTRACNKHRHQHTTYNNYDHTTSSNNEGHKLIVSVNLCNYTHRNRKYPDIKVRYEVRDVVTDDNKSKRLYAQVVNV